MEKGTGELAWFALRVLAPLADTAVKVLRRDGLVAVLKTEQRLRRRTKWDKERRYLTFNAAPGYVWIATPAGKDPRCFVRPLHIFQSFVGDRDGQPLELPAGSRRVATKDGAGRISHGMLDFLSLEEGELPGYYRFHRTGREFSVGDTVIINAGPFMDRQVEVKAIEDGEVLFFMRLLGKDHEARVSVHDVVKAEAA